VDVVVPLRELGRNLVQDGADMIFRDRENPRENSARPFRIPRAELPQKDPGLIRLQNRA
jgi:hypothetical protein